MAHLVPFKIFNGVKDCKKEEIGDTMLLEEYELYKDLPPLMHIEPLMPIENE